MLFSDLDQLLAVLLLKVFERRFQLLVFFVEDELDLAGELVFEGDLVEFELVVFVFGLPEEELVLELDVFDASEFEPEGLQFLD